MRPAFAVCGAISPSKKAPSALAQAPRRRRRSTRRDRESPSRARRGSSRNRFRSTRPAARRRRSYSGSAAGRGRSTAPARRCCRSTKCRSISARRASANGHGRCSTRISARAIGTMSRAGRTTDMARNKPSRRLAVTHHLVVAEMTKQDRRRAGTAPARSSIAAGGTRKSRVPPDRACAAGISA